MTNTEKQIRNTSEKLITSNELFEEIFEEFEKNYLSWTTQDLLMWLKSIGNTNFLVETHLTLITLIEEKKTTGKTLQKDLTWENFANYRVFGFIQLREREKLLYQIHRLTGKCGSRSRKSLVGDFLKKFF